MTGPADGEAPAPYQALNWDPRRSRAFAEQALEILEEFYTRLPALPVATGAGQPEVARAVTRPVPERPLPDDELFGYLREVLFGWSAYPGHPRFLSYVTGSGTVPGAVAELLAAAVNMNLGGWCLSPSATEIELHLMRWFADQFRFPDGAGGLMVSGGAVGNLVALKVARDRAAGWDVRARGVAAGPRLVAYASEDVHVVTDRAMDMLGLGTEAVRKIPVDRAYRMDVAALREAIRRDRGTGVQPFAVVATAGTTATGAIDPLDRIAELCAAERLWLHVDAAYGGPAVLADDLRPLFAGVERADSLVFDPHKWLYIPQSAGCVLVRDVRHLAASYDVHPSFIHEEKEHSGRGVDIGAWGPQFSRGFQALKVWLSLLAHGRAHYAARISHDAALARYLAEQVRRRPEFELAAPVTLSTCCFRYVPPGLPTGPETDGYVDRLNARLMTEIQLDGRSHCSNAVLNGRFVLRACVVNHRTEAGDVCALLDVAAEIGAKLDAAMRGSG